MKKIILFLLVFAVCGIGPALAQQVNYSWGVKETSGDAWTGAAIAYLDTNDAATSTFIYDLNDYYFVDARPLVSDDSVIIGNSDRFVVGTFTYNFDNQGGAPTADSLAYYIKAYPGMYTTASKSIASVKWGTAVVIETINRINDYFNMKNIHLHATLGKAIPPELIKIEIEAQGTGGCDDSTAFNWMFAYPAIYQAAKERK